MKPFIFRILISRNLKNTQHLCKPPFLYSISLLFSSSASSLSPKKAKSKIPLADYLINQHNFSPECALEASSIKSYLKNPEKSNSVLSFLKENGFSNTHLERLVVRRPAILAANVGTTLKPKLEIFQEFGFSSSDIADIISDDPWILHRSADNQLRQSILVLKSVLGSNADVHKVLKISAWFLKFDLMKTLMPNIEFLKSCGVSSSQIVKYLFTYPTLFLQKPENIKSLVQRVDEIGFDRNSKMFLPAVRTISMTRENWERKLKVFRSLGFSEGDILSMFRSMPPAFSVSESKIREVTETLLGEANVDLSFIVKNPSLLLSSIENCLKPRMKVYDILKSKSLLPKRGGLATMCKMSKRRFIDKYVLPYHDKVGDLYFLPMAESQ